MILAHTCLAALNMLNLLMGIMDSLPSDRGVVSLSRHASSQGISAGSARYAPHLPARQVMHHLHDTSDYLTSCICVEL